MSNTLKWASLWLCLFLLLMLLIGCSGENDANTWSVTQQGTALEIAFGSGTDYPQYAVFDLASGYLRMVPTRSAVWGTSVILPPSFWSNGVYHQGAAVEGNTVVQGTHLLLTFSGTNGGLPFSGTVNFSPPGSTTFSAIVTVQTTGQVPLDARPGEAFKPVMLSSMHVSDTQWDAQQAVAGTNTYPIPANGWIINPPVTARTFGLVGGTSQWKTNAPTMEITLDRDFPITGWVTESTDPNDDNVGFWAATDTVLTSWSYSVTSSLKTALP